MTPQSCLTSNSTGPQQVDDVYVMSQVTEDLQFGHQGLLLCGVSTSCGMKEKIKQPRKSLLQSGIEVLCQIK